MKAQLLTHGIWLAIAASAFVLGSQFFPADGDSVATGDGADKPNSGSEKKKSVVPKHVSESASASARAKRIANKASREEKGPLTEESIKELGEAVRNAASPVERRLAFSQLLDGLTAGNALQIREEIAQMHHHSAEFREFHYAWGALAGPEAAMFGADTKEDDMAPALAGWANKDFNGALMWLENLKMEGNPAFENALKERKIPEEQLRNHLMRGLVQGLADADPERASEFVQAQVAAGNEHAIGMMHMVAEAVLRTEAPEEAAVWADGLPDGHTKNVAMHRVAHHYARRDLEAAVEWAEGIGEAPEAAGVIATVGSTWASKEPEEAIGWLSALPAGEGQNAGMARALHQWTGKDAMAASEFLVAMPESKAKDAAISGFSHRLAWEDPESAIAWAGTISSDKRRNETLAGAARAWRHKDPEAATQWVMASTLPEEMKQAILQPDKREENDE